MKKALISLFFTLLVLLPSYAQQSNWIFIEKITLKGHKKTHDKIILRELDFHVGDTINASKIKNRFEKNREMLINSTLFSKVDINIGKWDYDLNSVEIVIDLQEAWYIFPFGWASLADRNFNVWWEEKNRDFRRINYQIGLRWNNLTGRRDLIKVSTAFGFDKRYELDYKIPGINRRRTIGLYFNALQSKNKEVWYATSKDSLQFYRNEATPQITRQRLLGGLTYRPKLRTMHALQLSFYNNSVDEVIAKERNPDFFLRGATRQRYFSLFYKYSNDWRDNKFYPQRGHFITCSLQRDGLVSSNESVQAFYFSMLYAQYVKLYQKKVDYENIIKVRKEITGNKQPYFNIRALGYGYDYLRGYEYYVIDGANFIYSKNSVRFELLNKLIDLGEYAPPKLRYYPIKIWLAINSDFGYVRNPSSIDNKLPNRLLWGRGIGLNIKVFQMSYMQIELSQNHLKQTNLFLHTKLPLE
jgi:outer membrane protein assembly factor BamA